MVPCLQTVHRRVISSPAGAVLSTSYGAIFRSIISSEMLSFCTDLSAVPALQAGSVVQRSCSFFNVLPEILRKHVFHFKRPAFPKRNRNFREQFIILSFIFIIFRCTWHIFFMQILILLFQNAIKFLFLPMAGANIEPAQNSVLKNKRRR